MRTPTEAAPIMTVEGMKVFTHVGPAPANGLETYSAIRKLVRREYKRLVLKGSEKGPTTVAPLLDDWLSDLGRLALLDPSSVDDLAYEFLMDLKEVESIGFEPWLAVVSERMAAMDYGHRQLSDALTRRLGG